MKVGIYCTNNYIYPVPPGTIYANMTVAGDLVDSLVELGQDVTFFAPEGTQTRAKLVTFGMKPFSSPEIYSAYPHKSASYEYENLMMIQALNYLEENHFDLFHSHCRPFSVAGYASLKPKLPTLISVHDPLTDSGYNIISHYQKFKNLHFVSLSLSQQKPRPEINWAGSVSNGLDLNQWSYSPGPGKYLLFVGRIMEEKGVDIAVQVALKTGMDLKIAGTVYPDDQDFFDEKIKPFLNDKITYLGGLPREDLAPLYGNAVALLMPIRWPEPFGLVMIEAMACGTPVIASNFGSVPEIIVDGKTGYIVEDSLNIDAFASAIQKISSIKRENCRKRVEKNFTLSKMATNYLNLYQNLLER